MKLARPTHGRRLAFAIMRGRTLASLSGVILLALHFAAGLGAQTLLFNYSFEGSSNNASSVASGLTVNPLATNGINYLGSAAGLTPPDNSTNFGWIRPYSASGGLSTDSADQTDWPGALAAGDYLSVGVTVASGQTLSLSSASFSAAVDGFLNITSGYALYSSVTGFSGSPLATDSVTDSVNSPQWGSLSFNLTGYPSLQGLGPGTYEFRFYLADNYYSTLSFQGFYLDNIQFNGTVSAIPEPSVWASAAGAAVLGAMGWRRRRTAGSSARA
jgi:hypothetical protein